MQTNIKGDFYCTYCNRHSTTKQGNRIHEKRCIKNPNRIITIMKDGEQPTQIPYNRFNEYLKKGWLSVTSYYEKTKGISSHNKGKFLYHKDDKIIYINDNEIEYYEQDGWIHGSTENMKINCKKNRTNPGKANSLEKEEERRKKISETMKKNNLCGGYRKGSGRGHKGIYKGIYCDSSWELAFVVYYIEHNMFIKRCDERREYIYNGEKRIYLPDFITDNGIIEIKGYSTKQWQSKLKQNPDINVLYEDDMKIYIEYVENKYGKKFWEILYEN